MLLLYMDPELWGPKLWYFLHTISFEYEPTPNSKNEYAIFFNSLKHIIPCNTCKKHYEEFLIDNPVENSLDSKDSIIRWVLKCHNNVNKINNKREWSYEELIEKYTSIFKNDLYNKLNYKNLSILLGLIIVILLLFMFFVK